MVGWRPAALYYRHGMPPSCMRQHTHQKKEVLGPQAILAVDFQNAEYGVYSMLMPSEANAVKVVCVCVCVCERERERESFSERERVQYADSC